MQLVIRIAPAAVLFVTVCSLLLGHLSSFGEHSPLLHNLRNALHGPAFFLATLVIWRTIGSRWEAGPTTLASAALVSAAAFGGEALQFATGHPFSLRDIGFDLLGCAAALLGVSACVTPGRQPGLKPAAKKVLTLGAGLLLAAVLFPVLWWSLASGMRAAAMPQIMNPDFPWWRTEIQARRSQVTRLERPPQWPSGEGRIVRVEAAAGRYAAVVLPDPYPDWRGFTALSFVAASGDGRERRLTLRIHDDEHDREYADRYTRYWHLGRPGTDGVRPGADAPQRFCVPLPDIENAPAGRQMDLGAISALVFFMTRAEPGDSFLLGDVRLEKSAGAPCPAPAEP